LHDADIVVPTNYINMILSKLDKGWDAVHPIRFLFYFDKHATKNYISAYGAIYPKKIGEIRANFVGGSVALRREAYYRIGGMDENFIGWGFEDIEFYQRIVTMNIFQGRVAPAIHLWHPATRSLDDNPNTALLKQMNEIPVNERIKLLRSNYPKESIKNTNGHITGDCES